MTQAENDQQKESEKPLKQNTTNNQNDSRWWFLRGKLEKEEGKLKEEKTESDIKKVFKLNNNDFFFLTLLVYGREI